MEKEEAKIREDIHKMILESKTENRGLSQRLADIDESIKTLAKLYQDLYLYLSKEGINLENALFNMTTVHLQICQKSVFS